MDLVTWKRSPRATRIPTPRRKLEPKDLRSAPGNLRSGRRRVGRPRRRQRGKRRMKWISRSERGRERRERALRVRPFASAHSPEYALPEEENGPPQFRVVGSFTRSAPAGRRRQPPGGPWSLGL